MNDARHFLVVSHTGRQSALEATGEVCSQLLAAGAVPVIAAEHWDDVHAFVPKVNGEVKRFEEIDPHEIELVIVLGGDGTILRAAELMRDYPVALLGVNLGHVGFLAESERDDLGYTVARALARDYTVEERMTLSVRAKLGDEVVYESWALNEATVEKAERERMLEVVVEVDRRPLSSFGCDGRRTFDLPPGARVIVRKSPVPVRLARLHEAPFTDRLVNKFQLPVTGWRGPVGRD